MGGLNSIECLQLEELLKINYFAAFTLFAAGVLPGATIFNLNTGAAGSGWQVAQATGAVSNNGAALNTQTSAVVLTGTLPFAANVPGLEAFAWANPFGGAVWVGQLATDGQFTNGGSITCGSPCGATAGNYVYTYSFDGSNGGSIALNGFTGENRVLSLSIVQANNATLYSCTAGGPGTLCAGTQTAVTAATGTLSLASVAGGLVTVTATVQNLDGPGRNPSGFILAGSATVNDAQVSGVPEPSTLVLLGAGLAGLIAVRRKR
jgi:hypothetical protein